MRHVLFYFISLCKLNMIQSFKKLIKKIVFSSVIYCIFFFMLELWKIVSFSLMFCILWKFIG